MVNAGDDLDMSGLGERSERLDDVPCAGAFDESDSCPEVGPVLFEIVFEPVAKSVGVAGMMNELHDQLLA